MIELDRPQRDRVYDDDRLINHEFDEIPSYGGFEVRRNDGQRSGTHSRDEG